MSNERLAKQMMKCDGTNKNCEGCMFVDHPGCRNAMAHHGGAVIQLQDVVIQDLGETIGAIKRKLQEKTAECETIRQLAVQACYQANALADSLAARKDCVTCKNDHAGAGTPEICHRCREGENMWILADAYRHQSLRDEDENEMDEEDDFSGPDEDEDVIELK